jgi:hypothetical protein
MKQGLVLVIAAALACSALQAQAVDATGQRYIDQLTSGGPVSISQAAQSIYHTGLRDQEVLDVAAQVLSDQYRSAAGNTEADAYAWVCKALAQSGNGRYQPLIAQVAQSDNRKIAKHCAKAAKSLTASNPVFVPGSVNLAKYRAGGSGAASASKSLQSAPASRPAGSGSFGSVVIGMSMDEVNAILGAPSATYSHQTGKAWIPFNFQGKDVARVVNLYKGQGRVTFSQDSVYSSVWRVLEVLPNPNETGYP